MSDLENILISFSTVSDNNLISSILLDNEKKDGKKNRKIIKVNYKIYQRFTQT